MKKLPLNINTFSKMIQEDYIYVDKTSHIFNLFSEGERYFFLSRPRRFGKSLLVSTLKSLFRGERELFQNLNIGKQNFEWQEHPVIHLDFSYVDSKTEKSLEQSIEHEIDQIADSYKIDISRAYSAKTKLKLLVEKLSTINSVVILVDEYDKPILDHIKSPSKAKARQAVLKNFYDTFKGLDGYLRCIFITGVSKFSKTSIFSGLNNLHDISYEEISAELTGYAESEILKYFISYLERISHEEKIPLTDVINNLRFWYNGYQFSSAPLKVYNPLSVSFFLSIKKFQNFWFETGTPSFLIEALKKQPFTLRELDQKVFTLTHLGTFQIEKTPLETLFFQSGYLTIKSYDPEFRVYKLGYPNEEIKQSLAILEMAALSNDDTENVTNNIYKIRSALEHKNLPEFLNVIQSLLATIPSQLHINREAYYHSLIQLLCNLINVDNQAEISTSNGRIDLTIITKKYIYIIEFKFNHSASDAINQILQKKYYERYSASGKAIILVGLAFSYENKELTSEIKEIGIQNEL